MSERHILIIDDEEFIRRALADYMAERGYKTTAAADGAEGLARARAEPFDLALVDLRMPNVDGLAVIAALKAEQPQLPVIVVSGTGVLGDAIEAMRRGAWDYITKPIQDMNHVALVVERALDKARLIAERDRYQRDLEQLNRSLEAEVARQTQELRARNRELEALNAELEQKEAALKQSEARYRRRSDELLALNNITLRLNMQRDISKLLQLIVNQAVGLLGADTGGIYLYDSGRDELRLSVADGLLSEFVGNTLKPGEGLCGKVFESRRSTIIEDSGAWPGRAALYDGEPHTQFTLAVPLPGRENVLGVLKFGSGERRPPFDEYDIWLADLFASQAAVALENARLYSETRRQAQEQP